jgi:cytochrome c oxidase cbb3-type subunit 1
VTPVAVARRHAALWLVVACGCGLAMAALLSAPALGPALGAATFGRLASVHLDTALYGWCALPLVALLLRTYDPGLRAWSVAAEASVQLWSGVLATGVVAWLAGVSSGKVFLEWWGFARGAFLSMLVGMAAVLAWGAWSRRGRPGAGPRALLWVALASIPAAMALATSRGTYPPVNAASGGPTGADLLGSTLCVIAIVIALPFLLGLAESRQGREAIVPVTALALHGIAFAALGRGDHDHREVLQGIAVASVAPWIPALAWWLRRFTWPEGSRRWGVALAVWGTALVVSGVGSFLPGVLDRVKFTNVLVGHAHLAMAGMASAFGGLVWTAEAGGNGGAFGASRPFLLWQGGCAAHVVAVTAAGIREVTTVGAAFRPDAWMDGFYAVRLGAGVAMTWAALSWWRGTLAEGE